MTWLWVVLGIVPGLLVLAIALVALVLLWPVRYRVYGKVDVFGSAPDSETDVTATVRGFPFSVRVRVLGKQTDVAVRIFGFKLNLGGPKADEEPAKEATPAAPPKEKVAFSQYLERGKAVWNALDIAGIWAAVKDFLARMYRKVKPRRLRVRGVVGWDNPAVTGQLYGLYAAANGVRPLRNNVDLACDFHQKIVALDGDVRGRFRLGGLAWLGLRLYLQKPINSGVKALRKAGKQDEQREG